MDKNLPANAGDTGSIPGLGQFHMPQSSSTPVPQLLSPHSRTCELQLMLSCAAVTEVPACLDHMLCNERSHCNEKETQALRRRVAPTPLTATRGSPCKTTKTKSAKKIIINKGIYKI